MAVTEERPQVDIPDWEDELARVGFVRRIFRARKWYKADWWFVAISSIMVLGFTLLAIAPQLFAPENPREIVGPRNLAPGEVPATEVLLVVAGSGVDGMEDLAADERVPFGVIVGTPSSDAARDEADRVSAELEAAGSEQEVRLRITRFQEMPELLDALVAGEVVAGAASTVDVGPFLDQYPEVEVRPLGTEDAAAAESFALGTNQLGQDVLSRLIWGTRVAFVIGFASALFALMIGLPLGLLSGFAGGKFDRTTSLIMDSIYAFPGLILAIAIAAVLGPSVLNVVVAIAVLYIPTYFRIVRGQTLSTKQELHVEAGRSLGAKRRVILGRYIFPLVIPSVAIIFSVNVADAILTGAALSFLGLGLPPDTPDWGIDLARGQESMQTAWWLVTFPGIAVMLVVLAFTMLGEGLVEIFNPRLRDR